MIHRRRCILQSCVLLFLTCSAGVLLTSHTWHTVNHHQPPTTTSPRTPPSSSKRQRLTIGTTQKPSVDPSTKTSPPSHVSTDQAEFVELRNNDSLERQLLDNAYQYYLAENNAEEEQNEGTIETGPTGSKIPLTLRDELKKAQKKPSNSKSSQLQNLADRFPRFMIVGFGKAGTKALYEALKLHPQLTGPYQERRFFSIHYNQGLLGYLESIPKPLPGGYTMEKSPDYIISPQAPRRITHDALSLGLEPSRLKFVVILRDPIDRAVSEYMEWNTQKLKSHQKPLPSFEEMVLKNGKVDRKQPFLNTSCYSYHISRWLQSFPLEQMCFVDGDKFITDPYSEVHQLEQCMGLDPFFTESNFIYVGERGFYCFQSSKDKFCMAKSKGRKHPDVAEDVVSKLKDYFRPWNDELFAVTGRHFTNWDTPKD